MTSTGVDHAVYSDDSELIQHARKIFTPVTLPCGRVVPNRLFKAPLYEHLGLLWAGQPQPLHLALYAKWGAGGWGIIETGNVQVDKHHLGFARDLFVPDEFTPSTLAPWRALADAIHTGHYPPSKSSSKDTPPPPASEQPLALMQISHGGRQSLNVLGGRPPFAPPLAPSAVRSGEAHAATDGWFQRVVHRLMHQVPRAMTENDIQHAVGQFARAARLAAESGFDGVQVHAAHGYLVSEFISPKSNRREDAYGAETDPLRFLREIVQAIRAEVQVEGFVVGVKLNSADYTREKGEPQEERALDHVREIGEWGLVDFIEVSGGDYEDPQFIDSVDEFKSPRQVVFESFAERSMGILSQCATHGRPPPLVCLTGGLNTLPKMASVLAHEHAHLLGVGRQAVVHPDLPNRVRRAVEAGRAEELAFFMQPPPVLEPLGARPKRWVSWRGLERLACWVLTVVWAVTPARMPRIIGAGGTVNWHNIMMRRIAVGEGVDYSIGTLGATIRFYISPPPEMDGEERRAGQWAWWVLAGLVGVGIGVGLGQLRVV